MESFDVSAVQLAEGSRFDLNTLAVDTEFPDREEWLEDMEEELGLEDDNNNEDGKASLVVDTKGLLGDLLRRDMKMDNLDREGVSKADDDDATSLGISTNASGGVGDIARNHKGRKLENSQLKQQAILDNDEMERMRLECEELRRKLQDSRIGKNDGTEAAAGDAGAAVSETTGTKPAVDETPNNAEAGEAHCARDTVKKTIPDENAEASPTKEVTFEENHNDKTQTGSAIEQPLPGTGEK